MSRPENRPAALPSAAGYTHLLGVPMATLERLRSLYAAALEGRRSLTEWTEQHAGLLAATPPALDPGALRRLEEEVTVMATAVTGDFDRFLFLSQLAANLHLLQAPDPGRELHDLEQPSSAVLAEHSWAVLGQWRAALRAMTGQEPSAQPPARMLKALQVGTLEETYRWLQAAVAENPAASVQDLLTRAAIEVAEAKLELDRYDDLTRRDESGWPKD